MTAVCLHCVSWTWATCLQMVDDQGAGILVVAPDDHAVHHGSLGEEIPSPVNGASAETMSVFVPPEGDGEAAF